MFRSVDSYKDTRISRPDCLLSFSTASEPMVLRSILWRYAPPPARLLDAMCGTQRFYQLMNETLDGRGYEFLFGDIQRRRGQKWRGSLGSLPIRDGAADVVVYDPPFTDTNAIGANDKRGWATYSTKSVDLFMGTKSLAELHSFHAMANDQFVRALKSGGYLIIKLYDRHEDGILHMEHSCVLNFFPRFDCRHLVIYRMREAPGLQ